MLTEVLLSKAKPIPKKRQKKAALFVGHVIVRPIKLKPVEHGADDRSGVWVLTASGKWAISEGRGIARGIAFIGYEPKAKTPTIFVANCTCKGCPVVRAALTFANDELNEEAVSVRYLPVAGRMSEAT